MLDDTKTRRGAGRVKILVTGGSMSKNRLRFGAVLVATVVLAFVPYQQTTIGSSAADPFEGFDALVTTVMQEWNVPGLAVAAIRNGEVVLSKGFGFRDVEKRLPVTPQTLMAIGSKRKEIYERLRFLEPNATFRQRYQYNNLMFMTAGYLVERLTGQSWDDLIKQRIFAPLAMARSTTSVRDLPASGDYALPYMERGGKVVAVPFRNLDAIAPAGAINSSVEEMMRYIQMHLDQGAYKGKAIVSTRFSIRMQSPHSATPLNLEPQTPVYPEIGPAGYGLGVGISSYRGHRLVAHGGGIDGFISSMSWMPDDRLGVMVLTNFSGINPVPTIVMRNVYDRRLGLHHVDWVARTKAEQARNEQQRKEREQKREAERVAGTSPSHPLEQYAGTYEHPGYGIIQVTPEGGRLQLRLDDFVSRLEHFHYDVFRSEKDGTEPPLENARVTFAYGPNGKVESLKIPLEPSAPDIVFTRKPEKL